MLAASGALVHSPWVHSLRLHLKWAFASRSLTASTLPTNSRPFANLVHEVEERTKEHGAGSTIEHQKQLEPVHAIFEDASDEYTTVGSKSPSPKPSILALIAKELPTLLPQPQPNDTMVFENELDHDYVSYTPTTPTFTLSKVLVGLVYDGRHEEAYRLLGEIKELGSSEIPSSPIFEKAALAALSSSSLTLEERTARFVSWFTLIPPVHMAKTHRQFLEIRRLIFKASVPDIPLTTHFAMILASKGYCTLAAANAVPSVMRFAPSHISHQFVIDLEKADEAYWLKIRPEEALAIIKVTKSRVRDLAVRHLGHAHRFETAISLLPTTEVDFQLQRTTYEALLNSLERSQTPNAEALKYTVRNLRGHKNNLTGSEAAAAECQDPDKVLDASHFDNLSAEDLGQDIPKAITYLRKSLASGKNLPHPISLSHFFDQYNSLSIKGRALTRLRKKALDAGGQSTDTFLYAEMHYHLRQENYDLVIWTFAQHFYLLGVPHDDIITHYQRVQNTMYEKRRSDEAPTPSVHETEEDHDAPSSFTPAPTHLNRNTSRRFREKHWPKTVHTTLVWHALVRLAKSDADVKQLYARLIQCAQKRHEDLPVTSPSVPSLPLPPSRVHNVGSAAFTPFIRKLMLGFGTTQGAVILNDMLQAGFQPNLHHFTELAGAYARMGDAARAIMILDKMETAAPTNALKVQGTTDTNDLSDPQTFNGQQSDQKPTGFTFPAPDVAFYTSLLRGFIVSRNLRAIGEVNARMRLRHQIELVDHPSLEAVYSDIESLREEMGKYTTDSDKSSY